jgi:anti-sigma factor RsiW
MNCQDLEAWLHAYVDRELSVGDTAAADAHIAGCGPCAVAVQREHRFRQLLVLQPQERAPAELRAGIEARCRRQDRTRRHLPWLAVPALAVAAAVMIALFVPGRASAPLVEQLVSKHVTFSQLERPAELTTSDPREVAMWFQERADLRVVVPDYSPAGIRLLGARIADADDRRAAYLLYEKGRTLLSVFMLPLADAHEGLSGRPVSFRGHRYLLDDSRVYRSVAWKDGSAFFGLVSALDYDALLECADRLRAERARHTRL